MDKISLIDKQLGRFSTYRKLLEEIQDLSVHYDIRWILKTTLNSYIINIYSENCKTITFPSLTIEYSDLYPFVCPNVKINKNLVNIHSIYNQLYYIDNLYNLPNVFLQSDFSKFKQESIIINWIENYSNKQNNLTEEILKEVININKYKNLLYKKILLQKIINVHTFQNMDYLFLYLK